MKNNIAMIFSDVETLNLPFGALLFHTGDKVEFIYFIEVGRLSLERVQASGQITCFQQAQAGDILAEASAYAENYHCDARVLEDARLRRVRKTDLRSRLRRDPDLADAWASHLARTVQRARLIAEIRSFKTVAERLDGWLGEFQVLPIKGQWHSLAHELAVSPEALYRELAKRRA